MIQHLFYRREGTRRIERRHGTTVSIIFGVYSNKWVYSTGGQGIYRRKAYWACK